MSCDNRCVGDDVFPAPCGTCEGKKPSAASGVMARAARSRHNCPSGLHDSDTIEDAMARADEVARPDGRSYSGVMLRNKDLRRVVLLTRELRFAYERAANVSALAFKYGWGTSKHGEPLEEFLEKALRKL